MTLSRIRKVLVAGVGFLADVVASGLLHGEAEKWAHVALTLATLAGIYRVPNSPAYQPKHRSA